MLHCETQNLVADSENHIYVQIYKKRNQGEKNKTFNVYMSHLFLLNPKRDLFSVSPQEKIR